MKNLIKRLAGALLLTILFVGICQASNGPCLTYSISGVSDGGNIKAGCTYTFNVTGPSTSTLRNSGYLDVNESVVLFFSAFDQPFVGIGYPDSDDPVNIQFDREIPNNFTQASETFAITLILYKTGIHGTFPFTNSEIQQCLITVTKHYSIVSPLGYTATSDELIPNFSFTVQSEFSDATLESVEPDDGSFTYSDGFLSFHHSACGTYSYLVKLKYGCSNAVSQSVQAIPVSFILHAPAPQIAPSDFPGDKAYLVQELEANVGYRWMRKVDGTTNEWEELYCSPRGLIGRPGTYKVQNAPVRPGCGTLETPPFILEAGDSRIRPSHTLSTAVLKNTIASSASLNDPDEENRDVYRQQIAYHDALGRSLQQIAVKAGSGGEDIIQPFAYDPVWGRTLNSYLPYGRVQSGTGDFDGQAVQNQGSFYLNHPDVPHDSKPFTTTEYDDSKDLTKVLKAFGVGQDWTNEDKYRHSDAYVYQSGDFNLYPVYRLFWSIPGDGYQEKAISDPVHSNHKTYWSRELIVSESRSEDGQMQYEFSNQLGQTVATRIMPRGTNDPPLTTYYVYDELGHLRMTIPPKVSELFANTSSVVYTGNFIQLAPDPGMPMGALVEAMCTRYTYDERGRQTTIYRPGAGPTETVYDLMDRPILSQDECQRLAGANTWSFVKYDRDGRVVLTGDVNGDTKTRDQWQEEADQETDLWETRSEDFPAFHGYTDQAFPTLTNRTFQLMTVQYYDDYTYKRGRNYGEVESPDAKEIKWPWGTTPPLATDLKGLPTGKKVRVLESDPNKPEQWLLDVYFYDERERIIATGMDTHFELECDGNDDWYYTLYDPDYGMVQEEYFDHHNFFIDPGFKIGDNLPYWKRYTYYPNGKLKEIRHQLAGQAEETLVQYEYDVFGTVKTKHLGLGTTGHALQHVDYKRNIRGWLTHINDPEDILPRAGTQSNVPVPADADVFGMELKYQNLSGLAHSSGYKIDEQNITPSTLPNRYDGTISGTVWKTSLDHVGRSYTYTYDGFNRLNEAIYRAVENKTTSQWGNYENDLYHAFDHRYDANGNILKRRQYGPKGKDGPDTNAYSVDDLSYTYQNLNGVPTNRLTKVQEEAPEGNYNQQANLDEWGRPYRRDYTTLQTAGGTEQYTWDAAGRLLTDAGKGITQITYNRLDLPESITFGNGSRITTLYAADGRKLVYAYHRPEGESGMPEKTVTTHYCNGWVYRLSEENNRDPRIRMDMAYLNTPTGKVVATAFLVKMEAGTMAGDWLYQHHIYDHQGNLRIAFQESFVKTEVEAGMEQVNAQKEEEEFNYLAETRHEDATKSRTGSYSARLNPLVGKPIGPMKWIPVERGDTVQMQAYAYYHESLTSNGATWQNTLAGFLLGSLANTIYTPTLDNGQPNPAYQQLVLLGSTLAGMAAGQVTQSDPTVPKAYLKWIHYDKDSVFISQGYMAVTDLAHEEYQQLYLQMTAEQDGYVQFFVGNESLKDVYFDDITGLTRRPRVIQQAHYYPFGLPMAKITTLGNPEYAYFFTGKELYDDEALEWYDYGARMYDVQIGRWTTMDPAWQYASPYSYCGSNPVNYVDPDGRFSLKGVWNDIKKNPWKAALAVGIGSLTIATGGLAGGAIMSGMLAYSCVSYDRTARNVGWTVVAAGVTMATAGAAAAPLGVVAAGMMAGGAGGAIYGGYQGYEIGRAQGVDNSEMFNYIGGGAAIGMAAGMVAGGAAGALAGLGQASTFGAFIQGGVSGGLAGGINGMGMTSLAGGDDSQVWKATLQGFVMGAAIGGTINAAAFKINDLKSNREGMEFAKELDDQGVKFNVKSQEELDKAIQENPHLRKMWERAGRPKVEYDPNYKYRIGEEKVYGWTDYDKSTKSRYIKVTNLNDTNRDFYWTMHHELRHNITLRSGFGWVPVGVEHTFMKPRDWWNSNKMEAYIYTY